MDNSYVTVDPYEEIVDHVSFGSHTAEVHTPQIAVRTPNLASFQESTPKLQLQSAYDAAESTLRPSHANLAGNLRGSGRCP